MKFIYQLNQHKGHLDGMLLFTHTERVYWRVKKSKQVVFTSLLLIGTILLAFFSTQATSLLSHASSPCDAPITNQIVCENSKQGNPASEWDIPAKDVNGKVIWGDDSIQGYATQ